jgi:hypothetical protein
LYGLCVCIHQLLFFKKLCIVQEEYSSPFFVRKGISLPPLPQKAIRKTETMIQFPSASLKRYWNQELWNQIYLQLLNPFLDFEELGKKQWLNLPHLIQLLDDYLTEKEEVFGKVRKNERILSSLSFSLFSCY